MGWGPWRLLQPHPTGRMCQHHSLDTEAHTASAWNAAPSPSKGPLSLKSQPHLLQEALLDQPHSVLPAAALPQALQTCDDCTAMSVHWLPRLASPRYDALDRAEVGPPHLAFSGCSTYTY